MSKAAKHSFFSLKTLEIGVLASVLSQPFEVLRTSQIMSAFKTQEINFAALLRIIRQIHKAEGAKGFFRGTSLAIARNTIGYAFFFSSLEYLNY